MKNPETDRFLLSISSDPAGRRTTDDEEHAKELPSVQTKIAVESAASYEWPYELSELKRLVALLPDVTLKAPRKDELIGALERFLLGGGVVRLWERLGALDQSAVAEAVHSIHGIFDPNAFHAKYGALPAFEPRQENSMVSITALPNRQIAEIIAGNSGTAKLCQRVGERDLVVSAHNEEAFRRAVNAIGYGMTRA